jgi:hypothetical protein
LRGCLWSGAGSRIRLVVVGHRGLRCSASGNPRSGTRCPGGARLRVRSLESTDRRRSAMTVLVVQHKVRDFDAWKPVFDEDESRRREHGA